MQNTQPGRQYKVTFGPTLDCSAGAFTRPSQPRSDGVAPSDGTQDSAVQLRIRPCNRILSTGKGWQPAEPVVPR